MSTYIDKGYFSIKTEFGPGIDTSGGVFFETPVSGLTRIGSYTCTLSCGFLFQFDLDDDLEDKIGDELAREVRKLLR